MSQSEPLDLPALIRRLAERPEFAALRRLTCDVAAGRVVPERHFHFTIHYRKGEDCNQGWGPEPDPLRAFALAVEHGRWVNVFFVQQFIPEGPGWRCSLGIAILEEKMAWGVTKQEAFWRAVQEWEKAQEVEP